MKIITYIPLHRKILVVLLIFVAHPCLSMLTDEQFDSLLYKIFFSKKEDKDTIYEHVENYLNAGGDVHRIGGVASKMPLIIAASVRGYDDQWLLDLLLKAGANPNEQNESLCAPVFYLIQYTLQKNTLMRLLKEESIDLSLKYKDQTPLQFAKRRDKQEATAILAKHAHAYPLSLTRSLTTYIPNTQEYVHALFQEKIFLMMQAKESSKKQAVEKDILTLFTKFFEQGNSISHDIRLKCTEQAIRVHSFPIFKILIDHHCPESDHETLLSAAIAQRNEPVVHYLVQIAKANIPFIEENSSNYSLLEQAGTMAILALRDINRLPQLNIMMLLLDAGADPSGLKNFLQKDNELYDKDIATYYNEHIRQAEVYRRSKRDL